MNTTARPLLALLALSFAALPGCFVFIDEVDDEPEPAPVFVNHAPRIDAADTFWFCEFDEGRQDYAFEFQARVDDDDGWRDVEFVDVSLFLADDPSFLVGSFALMSEGDGFWGGLVWESESDLFCGEAVDVLFEVWDSSGDSDALTLFY